MSQGSWIYVAREANMDVWVVSVADSQPPRVSWPCPYSYIRTPHEMPEASSHDFSIVTAGIVNVYLYLPGVAD